MRGRAGTVADGWCGCAFATLFGFAVEVPFKTLAESVVLKVDVTPEE